MKKYFVTGTDTDCGKTRVCCQLLDYLNQSQRAQALKPVASGSDADIVLLQHHNVDSHQEINGWLFPDAISPHLAAKRQSTKLSALDIAGFCLDERFSIYDHLLIEGAGGLMVPLNENETWIDFLQISNIPVILVVGMRLGCLNHALLTASVLEAHQLPFLGWIANCIDRNMEAFEENLETLVAKMPVPCLGIVPHDGLFQSGWAL